MELAEQRGHVQLGHVADAAPALELLAWEYAARRRHDEAARHLDRARLLVARAGTAGVAAHLAIGEAFCALCRGDLAGVARVLEERLAVDGGVGALGEPLTPQEKRIAALAARGASDGEIAAEPFLGPETVEHHLTSVYRKRGLRSRVRPARLLPPGG